ncbi:MAG: helix-turn-helix transcriptional regulator [Rhodospirillales bacterium]|nr:helix-turn-helix transcriptional regulator [Rhodospirillales bacterium]
MSHRNVKSNLSRCRDDQPPVHEDAVADGMHTQVARDIGREHETVTSHIGETSVVIHPGFNNSRCHGGLRVHAADKMETHDLNMETKVQAALTIAVFLEGVVTMELDGKRIALGNSDGPSGHVWVVSAQCSSRSVSQEGARVRMVLVSAPRRWIEQYLNGSPGDNQIARWLCSHGEETRWTPSKRVLALCEQILNPPRAPLAIQRMRIESKALEIFSEGLATIAGVSEAELSTGSVRAIGRAQTIRRYLVDHIDEDLSLKDIAREVGFSVESMQRAFKTAYNSTIGEFVREYRLHQARQALISEGISVSEAAYRARYANPANFSTAFKRLFGVAPSMVRA